MDVSTFVISLKYDLIAFSMLQWDYEYFMLIISKPKSPFLGTPEALSIYLRQIYHSTRTRIGPTFVSMSLGYY
jgi:hypothetical protein